MSPPGRHGALPEVLAELTARVVRKSTTGIAQQCTPAAARGQEATGGPLSHKPVTQRQEEEMRALLRVGARLGGG